jgi:hypothetical protein
MHTGQAGALAYRPVRPVRLDSEPSVGSEAHREHTTVHTGQEEALTR